MNSSARAQIRAFTRDAEARLVSRRMAASLRPDQDLSRGAYRAIVKELVARQRGRLASELELYCRCLGAFPVLVRASLVALGPDRQARAAGDAPACHRAAGPVGYHPEPWENSDFDVIDYEWYFDRTSIARILSRFPVGTTSVVALSVPTIVPAVAAAGYRVTLLDRSPSLPFKGIDFTAMGAGAGPAIVSWDLGEKPYLDADCADVVVMDPPWHLEHYRAWLHTAIAACRDGGVIALSVPQELTNRRAFAERHELLKVLSGLGPVRVLRNALTYVTPSFERAVLAIDGLEHLARWRRADLALVRVRRRPPLGDFVPVPDLAWKYRRVDQRIIRTWGETPGDGVPVIDAADARTGYRLSSVGRNYLASSGVNLVTSRGTAAVVQHWGRLPRVLDLMQAGMAGEAAVAAAVPWAHPAGRADLAGVLSVLLDYEPAMPSTR